MRRSSVLSVSCWMDMLMETDCSGKSGFSPRNLQTFLSTSQLISSISPFFSASGMNSPGEISTPFSSNRRSSESAVVKRPSLTENTGW